MVPVGHGRLSTGRVHVFYYDQGIDNTGDLTEVSYTFSDDGGGIGPRRYR